MKHKKPKKSCHKVEYKTKRAARDAIKAFGKARGSYRFYKCPHHDGREVYHLTSKQQ